MKFFIDSSNIKEIEEFAKLGFIEGCTTNPKIFSKDSVKDFKQTVLKICEIVDGPVSIETVATDVEGMVKQALELSSLNEKIVIKLPALKEGWEALKILKEKYPYVKTNMTICYTISQVLISAKLKSDYISIFYNRIKDVGGDPVRVIQTSKRILEKNGSNSKIIVGSIRKPEDVEDVASAGADIVTVTPEILRAIISNENTKKTLEEFLDAWNKAKIKI